MVNIFKRVDADRYIKIFNEIVSQYETPESIYETLLARANEAKGNALTQVNRGLCSLRQERGTLAENVAKVMDPNRPKDGYVEIGMPGRMIKVLKPKMGLHGRITVMNETQSIVQSGFPRPYDAFHTLDYQPLSLGSKKVDVISCFAGLHHCPEEKLEAFIDSLHESLRDGGILLVREHDTDSQDMVELAQVIHSVFNACTGVPLEEEKAEVRNFKGKKEWKDLLEKHGFKLIEGSNPLIREGDSTKNVLMKFIKNAAGDQIRAIREELITKREGAYTRQLQQSFLTGVEWLNVESAQNLGTYDNFWDYPFFRDVGYLWKNFYHCVNSARRVSNLGTILKTEQFKDSLILATMMTVQYVVQGILVFPVWISAQINRILPKGKQDKEWEKPSAYYQQWLKNYGEQLEVTPFYAQHYLPGIKDYWQRFKESWNDARINRGFFDLFFDRQMIKNVVVGVAMSVDLFSRSLIATPINWMVGGEDVADAREIGLIVQTTNGENEGIISRRYKGLETKLIQLINQEKTIVEIAGQTEIRLEIFAEKNFHYPEDDYLYERPYLADPNQQKLVSLKVKVDDLSRFFDKNAKYQVYRLYDY